MPRYLAPCHTPVQNKYGMPMMQLQLAASKSWLTGGPMHICNVGPSFGYFVNPTKSCLVVKEKHLHLATETFSSSGIKISCEGARYLGTPLGTAEYMNKFADKKVSEWQAAVESLSSIATSQPHAAYSALTHGLSSQWLFLQRTIPNLAPLLEPLESTISEVFIPALTGRRGCSDSERDLFALPARLGGLGITNPSLSANHQHSASVNITSPLTAAIINQDCNYSLNTVPLTSKWTNTRGRLAGNSGVILSCPRNRVSLTAGTCEYRVHHALVRIRASTVCSRKSHNDNVSLPSYPAGRECMQGCMRAAG